MKHMIAVGVIFTSVLCFATASHQINCNGIGTESSPGLSCKHIHDIQVKKGQKSENGIHWIEFDGNKFQVYCDMEKGGWTMVFKAVGGVCGNVYKNYISGYTFSEDVDKVLNVHCGQKRHYKNRIILNWKRFNPSEARVALYTGGKLNKELKFDARGSDRVDWFSCSRLIQSSWSDIETEPKNFFSIKGADNARRFFISRNYGGCPNDAGWMVITNLKHCHWEKRSKDNVILYSKGSSYTNWSKGDNVKEADVLVVYVR